MAAQIHPLHRAIYEPILNFDHIRSLIASDPSSLAAVSRQNGYSPLHAAARRGNSALMRLLVEAGCYVDARTSSGLTPFMIACQIGDVRILHVLSEGGADSNATDNEGRSPLHLASNLGSVSVMHYLVEILKVDPNVADNRGNTALHYAVQERVIMSVAYLLRHDYCGVDRPNDAGLTPVHIAAKNGSPKMVWELLNHSSGINALSMKTKEGYSPEELAKQGKNKSHKTTASHLAGWQNKPAIMRLIPHLYWTLFLLLPGVFLIIADLAFCYLDNPTMALLFGVGVGVAGFVFPVRPHRIPHDASWHNPAFMGAMLTEVGHTSICYLVRILPILWPSNLLLLIFLILNSIFGLCIFIKFKLTDPGFDKVGRKGMDGKPLTLLDVAKQEHGLSSTDIERETMTGSSSVLQFCTVCEIVIPDRTKHCKLCNACCNGFDHHCLWLTSCVGYNSHRLFVLFNLALTIEGLIYLWGAVAALYVVMGDDFPWNLFQSEAFQIEKWLKFRFLVTICTVIYTSKILIEQLGNISRLETTYFDLSGNIAYGKPRKSSFSWRKRLTLVLLFFKNYREWYQMSCQQAVSPPSSSSFSPHQNRQVA